MRFLVREYHRAAGGDYPGWDRDKWFTIVVPPFDIRCSDVEKLADPRLERWVLCRVPGAVQPPGRPPPSKLRLGHLDSELASTFTSVSDNASVRCFTGVSVFAGVLGCCWCGGIWAAGLGDGDSTTLGGIGLHGSWFSFLVTHRGCGRPLLPWPQCRGSRPFWGRAHDWWRLWPQPPARGGSDR